jgi:Tol biopolymer transport system component
MVMLKIQDSNVPVTRIAKPFGRAQRRTAARAGLLLVAAAGALGARPAHAGDQTFPGANGSISYSTLASGSVPSELRIIDPVTLSVTNFGANADFGTFSPNGQRFAYYNKSDLRIHVSNPNGTSDIAITPAVSGTAIFFLRWSPDGRKIAFLRNVPSTLQIDAWVANDVTRSTAPARLTTNDFVSAPTWANDSATLVYTSARDGDYELYAVSNTGTGTVQLTNNTVPDVAAVWAPNGSGIAYASGVTGQQRITFISTTNFFGWIYGTPRAVGSQGTMGSIAAWSPNSTKFMANYTPTPNQQLVTLRPPASGTGLWSQTLGPAIANLEAVWSPDNTKAAFRDPTNLVLNIINENTTGLIALPTGRIVRIHSWQRR